MGCHLLVAVRLYADASGCARYHGTAHGAPEWPPSPARLFQALVSGSAQGHVVSRELGPALEWLESLAPPVIAAPRARLGQRVSLFVPNNDADAEEDPLDVSGIRTQKVVHPSLLECEGPILYVWSLVDAAPEATLIANAANEVYQLGRGTDMAWAIGEIMDDAALELRLNAHVGTIYRPEPQASGRYLACPAPGSLASLIERHGTAKLQREGQGKTARLLFTNAPKARFSNVSYALARPRVLYELRDAELDDRLWPWPLVRVVKLVEAIRDCVAARLRAGLPGDEAAVERAIIGRKADGTDSSPADRRVRVLPLPSIGHAHADRGVRRILLELPSGAPLRREDIEWAFSGLQPHSPDTGVLGPFRLARTEADEMLRHYEGPSRRWRSVTPVVLHEGAARRRIEPTRRREEAKQASERAAEEAHAVAAVHVALRHAGIRRTAVVVGVQREPFDGRGARAEAFAEGTRFAKERLWHVELELNEPLRGPLTIGDGRFLGLGLMAPVIQRVKAATAERLWGPRAALDAPMNRSGLFELAVAGELTSDAVQLSRALRRAVMARAQAELRTGSLPRFFSGHEQDGSKANADHASHLAFHWDPDQRRFVVMAPHWLDRREPSWEERKGIQLLDRALDGFRELRAGSDGLLALRIRLIGVEDPLLAPARSWVSLTPYAVTRHRKHAGASEVLVQDVLSECARRALPRPDVTVLKARGVPGEGLQGHLRLDFAVAVEGPIVIGRTRYLGGGIFRSVQRNTQGTSERLTSVPRAS